MFSKLLENVFHFLKLAQGILEDLRIPEGLTLEVCHQNFVFQVDDAVHFFAFFHPLKCLEEGFLFSEVFLELDFLRVQIRLGIEEKGFLSRIREFSGFPEGTHGLLCLFQELTVEGYRFRGFSDPFPESFQGGMGGSELLRVFQGFPEFFQVLFPPFQVGIFQRVGVSPDFVHHAQGEPLYRCGGHHFGHRFSCQGMGGFASFGHAVTTDQAYSRKNQEKGSKNETELYSEGDFSRHFTILSFVFICVRTCFARASGRLRRMSLFFGPSHTSSRITIEGSPRMAETFRMPRSPSATPRR